LSKPPERVRVARVLKAHGLRGEVALELLGGGVDRLPEGTEVFVEGTPREIREPRAAGDHLLCRLGGVEDRSEALRLVGGYLEVPIESVRALPEGEYFHFQLVGLRVVDERGIERGVVADVQPYPANDVLVVSGSGGESLVPAVRSAVLEVDLEGGRLTVSAAFLEPWDDAG
jgi:16S rRNA processing protein RimM